MKIDTKLILCSCKSAEHQILVVFDKEDGDVWIEYHLPKVDIFKRLVYAIKYIFGFQSKFGAFGELLLDKSHISVLQETVNILKGDY